MISFIIPSKNSSLYIDDCLKPFIENIDKYNFEVIIIDDNSNDDSFLKIKNLTHKISNINIYKNISNGKVSALNYGFNLSKGEIIKCIDSDDIINEELFNILLNNPNSVIIHDSYFFFDDISKLGYSRISQKYYNSSFKNVIKNCISPPRWVWSFPRNIGLKIFPIPDKLPFEDFWFSIILNYYFKSKFLYINYPLYYYRQHNKQTYGGLFNFEKSIVRFRTERLLQYYTFLNSNNMFNIQSHLYENNINIYKYISFKKWSFLSFLQIKSFFILKLKYFFIIFSPNLVKYYYKLKFKL
jgi:glycosyltransferase involved in cell wall biosynthesis